MVAFTSATIQADTFGNGVNSFDIEFVPIGNPNNPDDTTGNARKGEGRFPWNAGAWFGCVVSSTGWRPVTAGFLIANRQLLVAMVPNGSFLITTLIAWIF